MLTEFLVHIKMSIELPVLWNKYWLFLTWSAMAWGLMVGAFNRTLMLTVGWSCSDSPTGINEIGGTCKPDMFDSY